VHLVKKLGRRRGQLTALGGLVYLQDCKSHTKYLVDTGAAVSVLPHSSSLPSSGQPLTGADGKSIASWGTVTRSLCFGIRTFLCTFILAAVSKPILGTDFLAAHFLLVDPFSRQCWMQSLSSRFLPPSPPCHPSSQQPCVISRQQSAPSLPLFLPSSAMGILRRVRCMVYAILWKLLAGRFLQRPAVLIRKSCAWQRPSSAI
jgi:hypothetical protein